MWRDCGLLRWCILPTLATLLCVAPLARLDAQDPAPRIVRGVVTDSSGKVIPFVNLVLPRRRLVVTDQAGEFSFSYPAKESISITLRRLGYRAVDLRLPPSGDTTVAIVLEEAPLALQTRVVLTERMRSLETRGFYSRLADKELGILRGEFVTPEEVERFKPSRATQVLEGRPGLLIRRTGASCHIATQCWAVLGTGGCVATVYLDGKRLNPLGAPQGTQTDPRYAPFIDDVITPTSIAGVEIYPRGAQAPPQYQSLNGMCAVVLIWTR